MEVREDPMTSDSDSARLKNAASLLMKGGTLTGEPCEKCGGVVVRLGTRTSCVACGAEVVTADKGPEIKVRTKPAADLQTCESIVEKKIMKLSSELEAEEDIAAQKQKAELLECYLRILEKVRSMAG